MPGLSIQNLRDELRGILGLDDIDLPDSKADMYINRSWWQLQNVLDLPANEVKTTLDTIAGTGEYAVSYPTEAILGIAFQDPGTGKLTSLVQISPEGYESVHDVDSDSQGFPEKYHVYGYNIILEPTPDDIYTLHVRRRDLVTDISDSNPDILADNSLHEVILSGAAQRGFIGNRDFNSAQRMKAEWKDTLQVYNPRTVKQESENKFAQVKLHRANEYKP